MRWIISLLLVVMTGCTNLVEEPGSVADKPENHKEEMEKIEKTEVEVQQVEVEKSPEKESSYKLEGRFIYFYSPEGRVVKEIDVLTRTQSYFDQKEELIERSYHPKKEVKSLGRGAAIQSKKNYYNSHGLITRSEIWMYGLYNNSVSFSYDDLLRLKEEVYRDSKGNTYTTKKYSYGKNFQKKRVSIYDKNHELVETEDYVYKEGRLVEVIYKESNGIVKDREKLVYNSSQVVEIRRGKGVKKYTYDGIHLKKVEEYDREGNLKTYHEMNHDRRGRVIKVDTYSLGGALTMREEYTY